MRPLCVDLDHTFLKIDSFRWMLIPFLIKNPFRIFLVFYWSFRGRAYTKSKLTECSLVDWKKVPIHANVYAFLKKEVHSGRQIILVSGANEQLTHLIQKEFPIFSEAYGSSATLNLIGSKKANFLVKRYGMQGFDYLGDAYVDFPVWKCAQEIYVVSSSCFFIFCVKRFFPNRNIYIIST